MVAWGIVMVRHFAGGLSFTGRYAEMQKTLMGIVKNYHGLLIARLFLGVAGMVKLTLMVYTALKTYLTEAGLYPGVAYYITMWYCRHEAQFRQALFFSAASIAGAFSGLLAYGIAVSLVTLS